MNRNTTEVSAPRRRNVRRMKLVFKCLTLMSLFIPSAMAGERADGIVYCEDGRLMLDGKPYRFIGTNFWYGAMLGAPDGNRERLAAELDTLHSLGLDNLRILAGADASRSIPYHVEPTLQTAPGVYNDAQLDGLDYLLSEMEKRGMKAVIYLNNSWEWSGGYTTYLEWAGEGVAPLPLVDGYKTYVNYAAKFVRNDKAKAMAADHIKNIVSRTNRYTGRPYTESPAIMSWQIANEPRAFSDEGKRDFADWILASAKLIKELDPNHMVSTGSEGYNGCEVDIDLWKEIHSYPEIDYANIHIWPYNWGWAKAEDTDGNKNVEGYIGNSIEMTKEYISDHCGAIAETGKPIVIEEFGYPRDGMEIAPGSATEGRDAYYRMMLAVPAENQTVAGVNFWGWGGMAEPAHRTWEPGDDYCGDPAQEDQGLYSVFAADKSTVGIIRDAVKRISEGK